MFHRKAVIVVAGLSILSVVTGYAEPGEQIMKLLPSDGSSSDRFGVSVAINGRIAVIGADRGENVEDSGAVYIFDLRTRQQLFRLVPDDASRFDFFGTSVAVEGDIVVIGATDDDEFGASSGAVYIFDAATGKQVHKLVPELGTEFAYFGNSVGICDSKVVIGARGDTLHGFRTGKAYIFDANTGEQLLEIIPDDSQRGQSFGQSVAINKTVVVVGATGENENGTGAGAAYLFDVSTGQQLMKIQPDDAAEKDWFGNSAALGATRALVGARRDDDNGADSGSVYVFDIENGQQLMKLLPDDGEAGESFGTAISIHGRIAIIGAGYATESGLHAGSAYFFDISTGKQLRKIVPADGSAEDLFGISVSLSRNTAVVGALRDDDNGNGSGSAYLFEALFCPSDLNADGVTDSDDLLVLIDQYGAVDSGVDLDGDGVSGTSDIALLIREFGRVCLPSGVSPPGGIGLGPRD